MPKRPITDTTLPAADLADLLLCSFRYALGRRTYITSAMSEYLRTYWHCLPRYWQELVQREIREAIEGGCAGDACDEQSWRTVLAKPSPPPPNAHKRT